MSAPSAKTASSRETKDVRELRAGVIGLGKLGLLHAGLAAALPGCRLTAVAESSLIVRQALAERSPDVQVFADYRSMLSRSELDVVFIATPTSSHVPIAIDCVRAGLPFFVEKPLSLTAAAAAPLQDALRRQPVANMVGYMTHHQETYVKAHEVVSSGVLGAPEMFRATMYVSQLFKRGKGWRYDPAMSGGGVLMTQNTHLVDLLLWLCGGVDWVSANTRKLYSEKVEDHVHAYLAFGSGLVGFLDASWSARHFQSPTINLHIQGRNGTLDVDDDAVRVFLDKPAGDLPAGWSRWTKPDLFRPVAFDIAGAHYAAQATQFLRVVRGEAKATSDVTTAVRTQAVVDAMYQSAAQDGKRVDVQ